MIWLAIETSCDETSAAIVRDGVVLANPVSSQTKLHADYGGVVPELAAREHLSNLPVIVETAFKAAGVEREVVQGIAATRGPGLPVALMIGFKTAQAMAYARGLPFLGIHHHEAHLYSPWAGGDPLAARWHDFRPSVSLIVSGGHTLLVHVPSELHHRVLGSTVDDAAGECFDKVAKLIGLPYPGGPALDRMAADGDPVRYRFPRPMLNDPNDDFSFAGLKTSVRYFLQANPSLLEEKQSVRDLCAGVQAAIVEVLVGDMDRTLRESGIADVGVGKRVKTMLKAFYGRVGAYDSNLSDPDGGLEDSLLRNIYRGDTPGADVVAALADYVRHQAQTLADQPLAAFLAGEARFADDFPAPARPAQTSDA
jgi:N6-L-threonylcarbamoyladenine synthase